MPVKIMSDRKISILSPIFLQDEDTIRFVAENCVVKLGAFFDFSIDLIEIDTQLAGVEFAKAHDDLIQFSQPGKFRILQQASAFIHHKESR